MGPPDGGRPGELAHRPGPGAQAPHGPASSRQRAGAGVPPAADQASGPIVSAAARVLLTLPGTPRTTSGGAAILDLDTAAARPIIDRFAA